MDFERSESWRVVISLIILGFSWKTYSGFAFFAVTLFNHAWFHLNEKFIVPTMFSSSNLARVSVSEKSSPSKNDSISIRAWWAEDKARFAFSTSRRSFCTDLLFLRMSLPFFFLNSLMKWSMTRWSKSSPPGNWIKPFKLFQSQSHAPVHSDFENKYGSASRSKNLDMRS